MEGGSLLQRRLHGAQEHVRRDRFLEQAHAGVEQAAIGDDAVRISGDDLHILK